MVNSNKYKIIKLLVMGDIPVLRYYRDFLTRKLSYRQNFLLKANESGCIKEKDVDRPMCCECGKIVPAKDGNTFNLYWHLKEHLLHVLVVNNYRSRLHPKNVDYLIFLSHNLS